MSRRDRLGKVGFRPTRLGPRIGSPYSKSMVRFDVGSNRGTCSTEWSDERRCGSALPSMLRPSYLGGRDADA